MKKLIVLLVIVGFMAFAVSTAMASGVIVNTKHNLSQWGTGSVKAATGSTWGTGSYSGTEICVFCHTPHNAEAQPETVPLWNHSNTATANFAMFYSATMNATLIGGAVMSAAQNSALTNLGALPIKACMACHDGTVAINAILNNAGSGVGTNPAMLGLGANNMLNSSSAASFIGGNLNNHHPVNFVYNTALATADGDLWDPTTRSTGPFGATDMNVKGGGTDSITGRMLFSSGTDASTLNCNSCHDTHGRDSTLFTNQVVPLLLTKSNVNSYLCRTCHNK